MSYSLERRTLTGTVEIREVGNTLVATGFGVVYGKRSQNLGGFVEEVKPGAARKTIQEADVYALANHDPNLILGRRTSGTLTLEEVLDGPITGVRYEIALPDTTVGRDWAVLLQRGDVTGSSFGFRTIADSWAFTEDGFPLRSLDEFAMRDIGPVTFPAYNDSTAGLRHLAEARNLDPETVLEAARSGRLSAVLLGETDDAESRSEGRPESTPAPKRRIVL